MRDLYMVKIGGGSITYQSKPRAAKREAIARILSEIYEAKQKKDFDVIIGHGSGSFGHVAAMKYKTHEGLVNEKSRLGAIITKVVASELSFIVIDVALGLGMGIPIYPFFPSSFAVAHEKKLRDGFTDHIKVAMENGFIPLVHGDVVVDSKQGISIASTEEVLRFISTRLPPKKIVLATDVDGIYDKDPHVHRDAKLIEKVTSSNIDSVLTGAGGAKKVDVTGGMKTKVAILYDIAKSSNCNGYIANATKPGVIKKVLMGEKVTCTTIKP